MSHLGRPKGQIRPEFSLLPVAFGCLEVVIFYLAGCHQSQQMRAGQQCIQTSIVNLVNVFTADLCGSRNLIFSVLDFLQP